MKRQRISSHCSNFFGWRKWRCEEKMMSGRIVKNKMIEPHTKDKKHQYLSCVKTPETYCADINHNRKIYWLQKWYRPLRFYLRAVWMAPWVFWKSEKASKKPMILVSNVCCKILLLSLFHVSNSPSSKGIITWQSIESSYYCHLTYYCWEIYILRYFDKNFH